MIPAFGREEQLLRAINSVKTCRPKDVEILVVDDLSPRPLASFLPDRNRHGVQVRSFRLHRNSGPMSARNLGIRRAGFSHLAFLDSDDWFFEQKIDLLLAQIDDGGFDILFHAIERMPREARIGMVWSEKIQWLVPFHMLIAFMNPVPTPALAIRRRLCLGVPGMRHSEDWGFLMHYAKPGMDVRYLPDVLAGVDRSQGAAGGLSEAVWRMRKGEFRARRVWLRSLRTSSPVRWFVGTCAGLARVASDLLRGRYGPVSRIAVKRH
ncbi:glycosyltransferase family 2 protein [Sandaracinobacter sp.]|uniref:glycosyltransferase family 2 protein n=1 Tax=Sandaracinobacter sp. TaxID=2487581 RepID=UPI0035B0F92C